VAHPLHALVIGQPMPSATEPLSTEAEVAVVCSHDNDRFRVTRLPATEATSTALHGALTRFQVLHFAGHATAVPDDPLESAMIMAQDQRLTVRDLLARGTGTARFALLSACDSARVTDPLSDELVNLPTALLQCGFSGVVGSLWTSYDKPSTMIMDVFYKEWQGHHASPSEALRSAQAWTRDHGFASPLAWANFVYVGP
jgi:CHAT domain-containing protein